MGLHFADLGNQGHPAARVLHMPLPMQTSLAIQLVLPYPLSAQTTHSHFISTSKEVISTVFAHFLGSSLPQLLQNCNERLMEASTVMY